jgi:hypothetical protein
MQLGPDSFTPHVVFECYEFRIESDIVNQPISDFILHHGGTVRQDLKDVFRVICNILGIWCLLQDFLLVLIELLATIH